MLIKQILLEELLLESAADNTIRRAMDLKKAIFFNYGNRSRTVDVYAIGTSKAGNPSFLGWMRLPSSSESIVKPSPNANRRRKDFIRWRLFRLDKVKNINITNLPYLEDSARTNIQKKDYQELVNAKKYFNRSQNGILDQTYTLDLNI